MTDEKSFIIGAGCVTPLGTSIDEVWQRFIEGRHAFTETTRLCGSTGGHKLAAEVPGKVLKSLVPSAGFRRLPRYSQLVSAAFSQCIKDIDHELTPEILKRRTGVFLGTSRGPLECVESISENLVNEKPESVNPRHFQETVYNAPLGHISVRYGICGPCITLSSGTSSGLAALEMALVYLKSGEIDLALVGGAETITPNYYRAMADLRVLSPRSGVREQMSPFAKDRNGIIASEGAVFLAIGRQPISSRWKDKRIEFVSAESCADSYSYYENEPMGTGFMLAADKCIRNANIDKAEIDLVLAAASGQEQLDHAEYIGLMRAFDQRVLNCPVSSAKGVLGDMGAAAALLSCALGCEIMHRNVIPAVFPKIRSTDPDCHLNIVRKTSRAEVNCVLINEASWGGLNSAVLMRTDG